MNIRGRALDYLRCRILCQSPRKTLVGAKLNVADAPDAKGEGNSHQEQQQRYDTMRPRESHDRPALHGSGPQTSIRRFITRRLLIDLFGSHSVVKEYPAEDGYNKRQVNAEDRIKPSRAGRHAGRLAV